MLLIILLGAGLMAQAQPDADTGWRAQFEAGKQAYLRQDYADAAAKLRQSAEAAALTPGNQAAQLEVMRFLGAVHREMGDPAMAEQDLEQAAARSIELDPNSVRLAAILEELSAVQRSQGHAEAALESIEKAIQVRSDLPESPRAELARDLAAAAMLRYKAGDHEKATEGLQRAIREWDNASPGDPQALPAIEALATSYRDDALYREAEPLLRRALRLREAASGPESAEVIPAVDSLAYIEFGLKKFPEAESLYKRLAALWEKNAGPDHPMLALTFDKMAEFYAFQQRYEDAGKYATLALAMRTRMHLASLNQTGRVLLMEAKLADAESLYRRSIQVGDLVEAPDDAMDPMLRIYAKVLRELKRDAEAEKLEARVKDALLRKADKEGRLPSPVTIPKK